MGRPDGSTARYRLCKQRTSQRAPGALEPSRTRKPVDPLCRASRQTSSMGRPACVDCIWCPRTRLSSMDSRCWLLRSGTAHLRRSGPRLPRPSSLFTWEPRIAVRVISWRAISTRSRPWSAEPVFPKACSGRGSVPPSQGHSARTRLKVRTLSLHCQGPGGETDALAPHMRLCLRSPQADGLTWLLDRCPTNSPSNVPIGGSFWSCETGQPSSAINRAARRSQAVLRVLVHSVHLDALLLAMIQRRLIDASGDRAVVAPLDDPRELVLLEQAHFDFKRTYWRTSLTDKRAAIRCRAEGLSGRAADGVGRGGRRGAREGRRPARTLPACGAAGADAAGAERISRAADPDGLKMPQS